MKKLKSIIALGMVTLLCCSTFVSATDIVNEGGQLNRLDILTDDEVTSILSEAAHPEDLIEFAMDNEYFNTTIEEINYLEEQGRYAEAVALVDELYENIGVVDMQGPEHPVKAKSVNECKNWSYSTTNSYYGYSGSGDNSDAFRHAYWNALMKLAIGDEYAEKFATAHEDCGSDYMSKVFYCGYTGQRHTNQDLHNNQLGRDCVSNVTSTAQGAMDNIITAIKNTKHYYLHANYACT